MEGIWDEAAQEFNKICGKSLEKGKLKSWNDVRKVIENIEKAPYNDDSNKDAWDRAKDAGIQVLNGLSLLTSLTSNVASFVCDDSYSYFIWVVTLTDTCEAPCSGSGNYSYGFCSQLGVQRSSKSAGLR